MNQGNQKNQGSQLKTELLKKNINSAEKAEHWLLRSYAKCEKIQFDKNISEDEMDALEALTGRFARLADILIHKVFRTIELTEFEIPGTLIDTVQRMIKRGLINEMDDVRKIKNLRNTIAHEYEESELIDLMRDCLQKTPEVLEILKKVKDYCKNKGYL